MLSLWSGVHPPPAVACPGPFPLNTFGEISPLFSNDYNGFIKLLSKIQLTPPRGGQDPAQVTSLDHLPRCWGTLASPPVLRPAGWTCSPCGRHPRGSRCVSRSSRQLGADKGAAADLTGVSCLFCCEHVTEEQGAGENHEPAGKPTLSGEDVEVRTSGGLLPGGCGTRGLRRPQGAHWTAWAKAGLGTWFLPFGCRTQDALVHAPSRASRRQRAETGSHGRSHPQTRGTTG